MESSSKEASAQWRPRKYVLVGMGGILAASTLIIVTSIILQPANIKFFITNFSDNGQLSEGVSEGAMLIQGKNITRNDDVTQGRNFTFDLISSNPSYRAEVVYGYLLVSMQLRNNGGQSVRKMSVAAHAIKGMSKLQPQDKNSNRTVSVEAIVDSQFVDFYGINASVAIMVFAQAQFKVGFAKSRVYNIRSGCNPIYLAPVNKSRQYNCSTVS